MSSHNSSTMTGSEARSGPPPAQKLKDSCDMCSSSKVKCNKEKPVCSRCRKLGYPCFYSPARRIGRPHPNRRTISRKSPAARSARSRRPSAINTSAPNTPEDSQLLCQDSRLSLDIQPSIFDENECSSAVTYGPDPMHWLDDMYMPAGGLGETGTATISAINWSSYLFNGDFDQKQSISVPQSPPPDFDHFNFSDSLNSDPQWLHSLKPQTDSSFMPLELGFPQSSSQGSSAVASEALENFNGNHTPISDSSEPDCVMGAIDILRRLQASNKLLNETPDSTREPKLPVRIQTAAWAIHRLSTILVCPCSRTMYVGVLVATVCMGIMDIYDSIFHRSHERQAEVHSMGQAQSMEPGFPLNLNVERNECIITECAASTDFESDEGEVHMSSVHILEELSKLADVVMQFARRYKGDVCAQPAGILSALADSLKLRLRSVTNEAFQKGLR